MSSTMNDEEAFVTSRDGEFSDSDYAAITLAVMETARGRWFLREFAKRNRNADTEAVLSAIAQLQDDTLPGRAVRVMDHLQDNLRTLVEGLAEARRDIARLPPADRIGLQALHPDVPLNESDAAGMERITRIMKNLRALEHRLQATIAICDPAAPSAEPAPHAAPPPAHPSFLM